MIDNPVKTSFGKCIGTYDEHAIVQRRISDRLIDMVCQQRTTFNRVYEIGAGTGFLTFHILQRLTMNDFVMNDLVDEMEIPLAKILDKAGFTSWRFIAGDAEHIEFPYPFDLIVSASAFQWFSNIKDFLHRISACLGDGGFLAFSTYGPSNLSECRTLSGKGLQYHSLEEMKEMLSARYQVINCSEETVKLQFEGPVHVLKHLKKTGVNGFPGQLWTKRHLADFTANYNELYRSADGVSLTYHPQYFIVKKQTC
jgi:malonyl-CoA O-methyltransferase